MCYAKKIFLFFLIFKYFCDYSHGSYDLPYRGDFDSPFGQSIFEPFPNRRSPNQSQNGNNNQKLPLTKQQSGRSASQNGVGAVPSPFEQQTVTGSIFDKVSVVTSIASNSPVGLLEKTVGGPSTTNPVGTPNSKIPSPVNNPNKISEISAAVGTNVSPVLNENNNNTDGSNGNPNGRSPSQDEDVVREKAIFDLVDSS